MIDTNRLLTATAARTAVLKKRVASIREQAKKFFTGWDDGEVQDLTELVQGAVETFADRLDDSTRKALELDRRATPLEHLRCIIDDIGPDVFTEYNKRADFNRRHCLFAGLALWKCDDAEALLSGNEASQIALLRTFPRGKDARYVLALTDTMEAAEAIVDACLSIGAVRKALDMEAKNRPAAEKKASNNATKKAEGRFGDLKIEAIRLFKEEKKKHRREFAKGEYTVAIAVTHIREALKETNAGKAYLQKATKMVSEATIRGWIKAEFP